MRRKLHYRFVSMVSLLLVAGCAQQIGAAVQPEAPGFILGLFQGAIAPFAFVGSLFDSTIHVYSVPNNGGWYNFGFLLGVGFWGGGAAATR